jgi:hypothetical protein
MDMKNIGTHILTAIVGGLVVLVFSGLVGGNQSDNGPAVGSGTRFPNGLSVDGTSPSSGQIRGTTLLTTGAVTMQGALDVDGKTVVDEFVQGGGISTLTDANGGAFTLTQAQMEAGNMLSFAAGGAGQAAITITLPASSTLTTLLPDAGDSATWVYDSSLLAAATSTTFAGGTGTNVKETVGGNIAIAGGQGAVITCWRLASTNVTCLVEEVQDI